MIYNKKKVNYKIKTERGVNLGQNENTNGEKHEDAVVTGQLLNFNGGTETFY